MAGKCFLLKHNLSMYEKSSFEYRTVNHDVSNNKIRFLWTYRHF